MDKISCRYKSFSHTR